MEIKLSTPVISQYFDVDSKYFNVFDYKNYEEFMVAVKDYFGTDEVKVTDSVDIPEILLKNGINPVIWDIAARYDFKQILDFIECEGLYEDCERMFEVAEERSQGFFKTEKAWVEFFAVHYLDFSENQLPYLDYTLVREAAYADHYHGFYGHVIAV